MNSRLWACGHKTRLRKCKSPCLSIWRPATPAPVVPPPRPGYVSCWADQAPCPLISAQS